MVNFEDYYLVDAEQIEYVSTRNGNGENPYGLFLNLKSGKELGVWYRTDKSRKQARERLVRMIESERRRDAEKIINRLHIIEQGMKTLDKRQMRIWRQLKALLGIEAEEKT